MVTLLESGNIRRLAPVQTDDGKISGGIVIEISPFESRYIKNIMWLSDKDKARARRLYAEAQRSLATK